MPPLPALGSNSNVIFVLRANRFSLRNSSFPVIAEGRWDIAKSISTTKNSTSARVFAASRSKVE
jgi:hypothetical protein